MKEKIDKLGYIKFWNSCASNDTLRKQKDIPHNRKKYLQIIYMIKDLYSDFLKNVYNSVKRQFLKWAKDLYTHFSRGYTNGE